MEALQVEPTSVQVEQEMEVQSMEVKPVLETQVESTSVKGEETLPVELPVEPPVPSVQGTEGKRKVNWGALKKLGQKIFSIAILDIYRQHPDQLFG